MPKAIRNPLPGFDDLTVGEQIDYVQALWEHISHLDGPGSSSRVAPEDHS